MVRFACPACKKVFSCNDELSGRQTKCNACGQAMRIPEVPSRRVPDAPREASARPLRTEQEVPLKPQLASQRMDDRKPVASREQPLANHQSLPWNEWLAEARQSFGKGPRKFDDATQSYLYMPEAWIFSLMFFVPLCKLIKKSRQKRIFEKGQVVWGHIIQANNTLWVPATREAMQSKGTDFYPGELVFSPDPKKQVTPEFLGEVAERLVGLREKPSNAPELKQISDYLRAETVRAYGWAVPPRLSPKVDCCISTTVFLRKHLPGGYLTEAFMPIVISDQPPYYAMPLPARYWPPDFIEYWTQNQSGF